MDATSFGSNLVVVEVGEPSRVGDPELSFFVLIGKQTIELEIDVAWSICHPILPKTRWAISTSYYELTLTCRISQYCLESRLKMVQWAM